MKKAFLFLFGILAFITVRAQDSILLTIGNYKVDASTFERAYSKNKGLNLQGGQDVGDYFSLYLKFRLKVAAALDEGMDTVASFKKELKSYRDQLAANYLTDNALYDSILHESYYRTAHEVKVAHIMVKFDKSKAGDTLEAYNKIMAIYKRLQNGESFENLAVEVSEDTYAKNNRGLIGYCTAFRFPYSFENACFNTPIGTYSKPFRTNFGYHIVKTYEKRDSKGEVKVAHIMVLVPKGSSEAKWIESKQKMESILGRIQKGEDFGVLAKELSDDKNSGRNNGELPWFGTGKMVPEFEEAAFNLKSKGDISPVIRTMYGWHIIKLLDRHGIQSFAEMKAELKKKIQKDERGELPQKIFVQHLKDSYNFKEFSDNLKCFNEADSNVYKGKYDFIPANCMDLPLFSILQENYAVKDFVRFMKEHRTADKRAKVNDFIRNALTEFEHVKLIEIENNNLESKFKDFKNLTDEYHDGILLFNIMDKEVWSKATHDSIGLKNYFEQHKSLYQWSERLEATVYKFSDQQVAEKAHKILLKNKLTAVDKLKKLVCDSTSHTTCLQAESRLYSKGDNPIVDTIPWKKGVSKIVMHHDSFYFVLVKDKKSPEPKKFEEVRGLVIAGYQNVLEETWVAELMKHYTVKVNQELLHKIAEKYNSIRK